MRSAVKKDGGLLKICGDEFQKDGGLFEKRRSVWGETSGRFTVDVIEVKGVKG